MSVNSKMTAIADAIRNLLDINEIMGLDAMANNISSITKRGTIEGTISGKSEKYIIPSGYHNGSGTVEISPDEQSKIIAENIKNGVTILGVAGSASGEIYSVIAVTYPEGSVCTCSDGTTTLTARDTSGKALFNVSTGTWTVTATDGSRTTSNTVSITSEGQVESVLLSFFSATINVTYPAGFVCTATDGVTALTAPDTSGTWECVVPNAGEWVFSLSSGYKSTVSVTQDGQTETLSQWYLYNNGAEYFNVVPFNPVSDASINYIDVTKNDDYINLLNSTGGVRGSGVYAIADLTGFTKLCIEITATGNYLNNGGFYTAPSASEMLWSQNVAYKEGFSASSNKKTYTLDVSGFSGEYGCCFGAWSNSYDIKMYRMWCE